MQNVGIFPGQCRCLLRRSLYPFGRHKSPLSRRSLLTLAIETSCDDTCVAVLESPTFINHNNASSLELETARIRCQSQQHSGCRAVLHFNDKITAKNTGHGGIHPIEALTCHQTNLAELIDKALLSLPRDSLFEPGQVTCGRDIQLFHHETHFCGYDGVARRKPDFVSVTRGPGMRSNLACGLNTAKGLAVAWQVPLLGVHHMQAHALTPRLVHALEEVDTASAHHPDFPFLTLLVSGGHTMLLYSEGLTQHKILANTADVAVGDTLDKCGRLLVPPDVLAKAPDNAFGKYLSQFAFPTSASFDSWPIPKRRNDEVYKPLNQFGWQMQTPLADTRNMTFSFSSIATRTEAILRGREAFLDGKISEYERQTLARTAIGNAFEHLGSRTAIALQQLQGQGIQIRALVVSGGVAANDYLRYHLRTMLNMRGFQHVELIFPPIKYCTDNAVMIAWTGMEMFRAGYTSALSIEPLRKWSMDSTAGKSGILDVYGWHCRDLALQSDANLMER